MRAWVRGLLDIKWLYTGLPSLLASDSITNQIGFLAIIYFGDPLMAPRAHWLPSKGLHTAFLRIIMKFG